MDSNITPLFVTAAQQAAADVKAREKAVVAAKMAILRRQIDEEFGSLLEVLRALPPKDGKQFSTNISEATSSRDTEARYNISVSYDVPGSPRSSPSYNEYGDDDRQSKEISLDLTRQESGALHVNVTQYSIVEQRLGDHRARHRSYEVGGFEAARRQLSIGLGTFAADRMTEIYDALSVQSSKPASAGISAVQAPADNNKIAVFKTPLRLVRNGAAADERETAAKSKKATPAKKPIWKLW